MRFHKIANVLSALPKSARPGAKKALAEIWNTEDKEHAQDAVKTFVGLYGAKWPKAVAKIIDDQEELLAFFDYPAEHWVHLRTTNPIESTFATVRLRTKVTKGPGSKAAGIAMAFKLIQAAQERWRAVNAPHSDDGGGDVPRWVWPSTPPAPRLSCSGSVGPSGRHHARGRTGVRDPAQSGLTEPA